MVELEKHGGDMRRILWTRDEVILALDLFFRSGDHMPGRTTESVLELSALLRRYGSLAGLPVENMPKFRNPEGVERKLWNLSYIATDGRKGLERHSKIDEAVWTELGHDSAAVVRIAAEIRAFVAAGEEFPGVFDISDEGATPDETAIKTGVHTRRDRDPDLRNRKLATLRGCRLVCEGCGLDFADRYGDRALGAAEIHHTQPLSMLAPGTRTQIRDLAVVCGSCHRVIHHRRPWLTMEHLRAVTGFTFHLHSPAP
jgi:5-methylcytosine-specific restriction protein A